jgi:proline iminopeptidase
MAKIVEGFMPFGGTKTYYRIIGDRTGKLPLLTFHGGPGASHSYLTSLDDLAEQGRQVIYYDQIGCGKSAAPSDPSQWTPELFVEEAHALRKHLALDKFHLLGQSWGGMLAIYFAHTQPEGLVSVTLASSPVSIPQWNEESARLLSEMPEGPALPWSMERPPATGIRGNIATRSTNSIFAICAVWKPCRIMCSPVSLKWARSITPCRGKAS